jgi:hypothetical protein
MKLRRIEPVSTRKLKAGDVLTTRPTFIEVDPADLYVDESYQRDVSERGIKLIRKIVQGWSWAEYKPPVVWWSPPIPSRRAHDPSSARTPRASASPGCSCSVLPLTAQKVCDRAKVRMLLAPPGGNRGFHERETMAASAITQLARRQGAMVARQILEAIADAGVTPVLARHLRAAELLMRDPSYAKDRFSFQDLTATIAKCLPTEEWEAKQLAEAMAVPLYKAQAALWHRNRARKARAA